MVLQPRGQKRLARPRKAARSAGAAAIGAPARVGSEQLKNTHARARLRQATAADHARVDAAFGAFDLGRREDYGRFLEAQAAAFLPVEAAIEAAGVAALLPDWPSRRRAGLLRQDLADVALAEPAAPPFGPLATPAAVLGAVYVLEGSRLGGRLLARGVPEPFPRRFISGGGSRLWQILLEKLEHSLTTADQVDEAIAAARQVFARFEAAAAGGLAGRE